ncbi:hypothetical protein SAMN05216232_0944 [Virgibacillus subterraneus]|uniref:DUF4829 domain-containing protein n=1 Tax=Virgibacillus subterraneus TaxID=621109 RepID=A0A1H9AVG4_9BACI|nr:hypothetical protein [Virgibacillus subterraneus]SEP80619.1 hypothetical protein SAMN05216232_0944 [Virgibacillus subterraneus]
MKHILMVSLTITLLISGCGTAEENSSGTEKSPESHQHSLNASKAVKSTALLHVNSAGDNISETSKNNSSENENTNKNGSNKEETFLKILTNYNNMFERIKSDVDYDNFNEEYVGYKFKTIKTKEQLYNQFTDIMTTDMAQTIWSGFVKEGDGSLYLIPRDLYPMFNKDNPYTIEKSNEATYKLVQKHKSELHGIFDMEFFFTKLEGQWKINEISFN